MTHENKVLILIPFIKNFIGDWVDYNHTWQCHGVHSFESLFMTCNEFIPNSYFNVNSFLIIMDKIWLINTLAISQSVF
jgi:hypothetical protein